MHSAAIRASPVRTKRGSIFEVDLRYFNQSNRMAGSLKLSEKAVDEIARFSAEEAAPGFGKAIEAVSWTYVAC